MNFTLTSISPHKNKEKADEIYIPGFEEPEKRTKS